MPNPTPVAEYDDATARRSVAHLIMKKMIDINTLVQKILSDLNPPKESAQNVQETPAQETGYRVSSKVISLAQLDKLGSAKRLVVPEKAVITPAVRDEIRRRQIEIVTENAIPNTPNSSAKLKVWLALHAQKKEPTVILDYLAKNYEFEKTAFECVLETMQAASEILRAETNRTSCIVLSEYSAAAVCVANRKENIRAVLGTEPNTLKIDAEQIGANLLVIDPIRSGLYKTQAMVKSFLADGVRKVPKYLES